MNDIIKLLPESLSNKIAAGEVVQNPASVVKELLENAIDAKATEVQLYVEEAGKTLIQVIDNGIGMSETDARMCFERHATSKIYRAEDLFRIATYGFRGEAMASIASVAYVELKTKRSVDETGTLVVIQDSKLLKHEPVACQNGTSVSVKNLFFNVPARKRFMKSNATELKHIVEEFQRVALAYPEIGFECYQDGQELYRLKSSKLAKRIVDLFGKNYQQNLIPVQEALSGMQVYGYIGKPQASKKTRGEQFFFVNRRFVKHQALHHAVITAFEGLIPQGSFPFYALNILLDYARVDINVSPTKTEVKFDDERSVYSLVQAAVRAALYNQHASIDFDFDINYIEKTSHQIRLNSQEDFVQMPARVPQKEYNALDISEKKRITANQRNWEKLFSAAGAEKPWEKLASNLPDTAQELLHSAPELPFDDTKRAMLAQKPMYCEETKKAFLLHNRYILYQVRSGAMLIDRTAAYERIFYDRFLKKQSDKNADSQKLLFPKTIVLNPADYVLFVSLQEEMKRMGFLCESFGKNTVVIQGVPAEMIGCDEKDLLEGILEQAKIYKAEILKNQTEALSKIMAKRIASLKSKILEQEEIHTLIDKLFASSQPHYSPSGKKIIRLITLEEFAKMLV
ncbi:MAG: DNA mismatch repair endonuclease MutL [Cytophagales bacterium]|nr:DNA mismatch repair endonuclease MutL [Cytophagales bacterium]MDW8385166.1 DNA mismatch repair endonuclease MutL [Flammeovirgaceae bacterium]